MTDQHIKQEILHEISNMMDERRLTFDEAKEFVKYSYNDEHIRALVDEL